MRTVKEKGIRCILLTFLIFWGMFAGVYRPAQAAHAAEDFRLWRQLDSRWGSTAIGGSTLRSSGCYVTSIAMVAVASGARDTETFNPGVFAKQLNDIGAFNGSGGLSSWASVNKVVKEISIDSANLNFKSTDEKGKAAEIKAQLDKGEYVICNVGGHWVYIDGVIGDDVYMADPAKDEILMFKAYKNANIKVYQLLKGKNPYSGFTPLYTVDPDGKAVPSSTTTSIAITTTTVSSVKTTTTTTTKSTTSKMSTTSAAVTTSKTVTSQRTSVTSDVYEKGEYYCPDGKKVKVFTDDKEKKSVIAVLEEGNVINVTGITEGFGEVKVGGKKGLVELKELLYAGNSRKLTVGDINDDGVSDSYDLALINEYIIGRSKLPDGISLLTTTEIAAADLSGDGAVDETDVILYLMRICS
ncbi:dockerin type I repeat-containing protein [Ruminococcus flavefaciens]|uniref:dockerin type I repeat-containing protein n=1 Tax=Ruminococcus flavefaciens TaxID=1265 RepID=UPI0003160446|nr:dockerin type I repeat-containing protein [Ruminococcus flavefaciens]